MVLRIYDITKEFPREEPFALVSQIRRVATLIPSNIVKGKARGSNKEYRRFLPMARGSLKEVKYQILQFVKDLQYIDEKYY